MEGFVAKHVDDYQHGRINRRRLIEILTLAATTAYTGNKAAAAEPAGLDVALVNHVSYTCPDYRRAADWYSKVFNLDQVGATNRDVALPFGKKGEKPFGVTANDVPLTHIICRTRPQQESGTRAASRPKSTAVIDHLAFTVADFDRERAKAELTALGVKNVRDGGPYSVYVDDPFGYEIQITGIGVTAVCGAGDRAGCAEGR
ncbi:MAG: VOC family protein [Xanthobacteraceae bacterium]|nr:VOC family protein [Xanthobacteraceae bacterium]